jgi:hypothetical protein
MTFIPKSRKFANCLKDHRNGMDRHHTILGLYFVINVKFVFRFEVPTAVEMKSSIFWDITACGPLKVNECIRGTCLLDLLDRRISQA